MKETKEALKARILDGAAALFIEKGIENVATRELTERLSISRSHIYYYFSDWQTLCIEALTRYLQNELDDFSRSIESTLPADKLNTAIENYLPDAPDAVWQLYGSLWQMAGRDKAFAELAELFINKWTQFITAIVDEGIAEGIYRPVDSARFTRQLSALLNGYADSLMISPTPAKHREAVEDIQAFIRLTL
ncbi:transcriptional regulator, TetR family [Candidatus Pantoea symbiotica]|jgi:AcrR family transcriptional regulator|uniref:Transcriptional regulator, TetR family n=1 Tax=Candidatus Pantoea symbiotica TaxID=1884370 RepID=A0A1I4D531_9GAMM|nr:MULTISPECIES: TetR/AcrR family transcriptional regulator [Pantoea]KAJ9429912.1 TetR/AcrR family transcriptional regulator [Pantoea sp. YR343]SFK87256.1 transcriptional regulator, TetR family [Pantoea symbiotica]SFV04214.1 transcriptional regulator, TetR family [Pantoea sp. YR525]